MKSFLLSLRFFLLVVVFLRTSPGLAQGLNFGITPEAPDPTPAYDKRFENAESKVLKTRVIYVPKQDMPSRAQVWKSLTKQLEQKTGLQLNLEMPDSQLEFERNLALGKYDIAYTTPLQFLTAADAQNYRALAKRKAQPLRALIIVRKLDEARTLRDIETGITGFDSILNYSSSIITRYSLKRLDIELPMQLFENEEALFNGLASGQVRAISIAESSFYALSPDRQEQLKILWETPGFAPFAFISHPRVPFYSINKLQRAMVNLNRSGRNQELVEQLGALNGFEVARNSDWLDARGIDVDALNMSLPLVELNSNNDDAQQ
jgi:phosphonate transport system substrate-binding protein